MPQQEETIKNRVPFSYVVQVTGLSGNSTTLVTKTLARDSYFMLCRWLAWTDQDAASEFTTNNFKVQITDQTTGRQLSDFRVPQNIISPAGRPQNLLMPVILFESSILQFDFENLTASTMEINFVLDGFKLYGELS